MSETFAIHLRDLGARLVEAWRQAFADIDSVTVSCGDIFSDKPGPIEPGAPIDVKADAIISPANSFGFMDGGIDAVYTYQFGIGLQERLQALIIEKHGGELPVGQAVVVATGHPDIPWCVSAPTMRIPQPVAETVNAYLAFRAALRAVLDHNASGATNPHAPEPRPRDGCRPHARPPLRPTDARAWDRVLGSDALFPRNLSMAADDEYDMLA